MIEITEAARKEIVHLIANEQTASALRLFVKAGGCAGMSYGMAFEEAANSEDRTFEIEGVSVFLDPKSYLFLKGVRLEGVRFAAEDVRRVLDRPRTTPGK